MARRSTVLSTYRIQFQGRFPFAAGEALAPYLRRLGISHVYSSPILRARAGSNHGYDVVSYDHVGEELGGIDAFRAMAARLRQEGVGLILDIVPNHVAVGGDDNAMWLDLLKHGSDSRYARWFDIEFDDEDHFLGGRVHAPFLGEPYREALDGGKLALVPDPERDGFALRYGEHLFPIRPEDDEAIRTAGLDGFAEPETLDALIARQNYRLDFWRGATDRLNWRRFFEVTQLAGIRMEEPAAFEAAHRIAFELYEEGAIDGLRIDHVDGLADPAAYCRRLRQRLDELQPHRPGELAEHPAYLVVEKILAIGEHLPEDWGVDGTTGYDFMDEVSAIFHDEDGRAPLEDLWVRISGRVASFEDEEIAARRELLEKSFEGQFASVVDGLVALSRHAERDADIAPGAMRRALAALICQMRSYRTYLTGKRELEEAGPFFDEALERARQEPSAELLALDFIAEVFTGQIERLPKARRAAMIRRFNQLTSPLAARSVEDTAFYRYGRLLSRNDVGFDARRFGWSVADFHEAMARRAEREPQGMLALATHDHKRGADVRARLAVISERPEEWQAASAEWFAMNELFRPSSLDAGDEYFLYQTLVGTWEGAATTDYVERVLGWWIKALREAKLRTGWTSPSEAYEADAGTFLREILDPAKAAAFQKSLVAFVAGIAPAAALNGLGQLILQCTAPGVPDTYQGSEFWDLSMVDPDNRRDVDFPLRERALAEAGDPGHLAGSWQDGRVKQAVLSRLLQARRAAPELFVEAGYRPLPVTGPRAGHVVAFLRETEAGVLLAIVPLRLAAAARPDLSTDPDWWSDTAVEIPPRDWQPVLGTVPVQGSAEYRLATDDLPYLVAISPAR